VLGVARRNVARRTHSLRSVAVEVRFAVAVAELCLRARSGFGMDVVAC
jgi:hypothetical protein